MAESRLATRRFIHAIVMIAFIVVVRSLVFIWCALQAVVDFEVGTVRKHNDLSVLSIGGED